MWVILFHSNKILFHLAYVKIIIFELGHKTSLVSVSESNIYKLMCYEYITIFEFKVYNIECIDTQITVLQFILLNNILDNMGDAQTPKNT